MTKTATEPKPTKAALLAELHARLGRCRALVGKRGERSCRHWAVDEAGYCGAHIEAALARADIERRKEEAKAELEDRIDEVLAWHAAHPSVHEPMPRRASRYTTYMTTPQGSRA